MSAGSDKRLGRRVARAAEEALADHGFVSPIDVMCGLGWLHPSNVARWRRGRPACLEDVVFIDPARIATAIGVLQRWARERRLEPSERPCPAGSRTPRELRYSADLVVIEALKEFTCSVCGADCPGLLIMEDRGPVCMACADLDQLVFLSSGDAALTRRARAASGLSAIVVRFSRARKRYERQGMLVEEQSLERAEAACLTDDQARARRRERDRLRGAEHDLELQERMAEQILGLFPGCPRERALQIAGHTAARGSGRVGRTAAGRALEPGALELGVRASVRHRDTRYDQLLMSGVERQAARAQVSDDVASTIDAWRIAPPAEKTPTPAAEHSYQ
ncbi:MAG: DUF2293 domain-containing protein [Solirubrobacteraceae bacterium]